MIRFVWKIKFFSFLVLGGEDERLCDCPEGHFKCRTGRCVPDHYVCDGLPQCADLSDDWDCFNITKIKLTINQTIDDDTTEMNKNALRIKRNNDFAFVCYENWNLHYADTICENLGFARSKDYSSIEMDTTNVSVVKINDDYVRGESILFNLNDTESCSESLVVALECEIYGKRSFNFDFEFCRNFFSMKNLIFFNFMFRLWQ